MLRIDLSQSTLKIAAYTPHLLSIIALGLYYLNLELMEKFIFKNEVKVWGVEVKEFPEGIGEAFDSLVKMLPGRFDRSFYGIAFTDDNGRFTYVAAAEEISEGEAEKYHCDRYTIDKGEYYSVRLRDWRKNTETIKNTFQEMMKNNRIDCKGPCIEWYKDDEEMICMVKLG